MTRLVTLIVLVGITLVVLAGSGGYVGPGREALMLGFLLLAAHLAGEVAGLVELPRITGFLVVGILLGPHALGVLPQQAVEDFHLLNGGALSLIALTAGGELRVKSLRNRLRGILSILSSQILVLFAAVTTAVFLGRSLVPFLADAPPRAALAVGLVFGLAAVATSPAATVAVITEEKAHGPLTETVLGVTVLKDVVVLVLIALIIPLAVQVAQPDTAFSFGTLGEVLALVLASIVVGLGVGWMLVQYLGRTTEYRVLVILLTAFFLVGLREAFHLEYILVAMAAGFYVQNFSRHGPPFLRALEANSLSIYALFFALAGADLRIDVLQGVWAFAVVILGIRAAALFASTGLGAALSGESRVVRRTAWIGFMSQAGVTLGIAAMVRERFTDLGGEVATVIVAMIAVNELIGPPAFRYALVRAGESRRRPPRPGEAA